MARTSLTETFLSGRTEKGKFSALGSSLSEGANRLRARHSRRRQPRAGPAARVVGVGEVEGLTGLGVPPAVGHGGGRDVVRSHEGVLILEVETADAPGVGRDADLVVRDALGGPDGADLVLARAVDLEVPDLFRVGEGEAFAVVVVAVGLGQGVDRPDGLAGGRGPFQGQPIELGRIQDAFLADQLPAASDRRLADGQLTVVHDRVGRVQEAVRLADLGDFARLQPLGIIRPLAPLGLVVDFGLGACGVGPPGDHGHPGPVRVAVAGVRRHRRTVDRGQAADQDAGAAVEAVVGAGPRARTAGRPPPRRQRAGPAGRAGTCAASFQ